MMGKCSLEGTCPFAAGDGSGRGAHLIWRLLCALEQALGTQQLTLHALAVQDVLEAAQQEGDGFGHAWWHGHALAVQDALQAA